ncbi:ClpXP protease specificity-enhancing factor SspB [Gammaproteobacteria bacterium]|nr:ClpXP protease specificity-enhancing factor SspB [Gammaproteobacteria bacterium]
MKSTKPYLIEALYKCISDSQLTPLLVARVERLGVKVPAGYDNDGIIVLDIAKDAVDNLKIEPHAVQFEAIFDGKLLNVFLPMYCILAIRSAEEQVGFDFTDESVEDVVLGSEANLEEKSNVERKKPDLKVL